MKIIGLIFLVFLVPLISAEVRINEIEMNPSGKDTGGEWVELYSDSEIDLNNWSLKNNDGDVLFLNESFEGFLVIVFEGQWLDNSDEKVFLVGVDGAIVSETSLLKDSGNDLKTLQYCDGEYAFEGSSEGLENNCKPKNEQEEVTINTDENEQRPIEDFEMEELDESESLETPIKDVQMIKPEIYDAETEGIKTPGSILYQSKNELIKQYSVYGFAILCAILCVLLGFNKLS